MSRDATETAEAIARVKRYLEMRDAQPIRHSADIIHGIHGGTKWEADLLLSDLRIIIAAVTAKSPSQVEAALDNLQEEANALLTRVSELKKRYVDGVTDE